MQFKFLALSALAATAAAQAPNLVVRQSGDTSKLASCTSALSSLITDFPTPPSALLNTAAISIGTATDKCDISYPSSLSSDVSSYASGITSWYDKNKDKVSSLTSACPDVAGGYAKQFLCASAVLGTQTASMDTATMTGSGSMTASSSSAGSTAAATTSSKGGAARETGAMMAAAAAAGLAMVAF